MTNPVTEFLGYRERSRDLDEVVRRAIWGNQRYLPGAGSVMTVRGTDYLDEDVPVVNFGYGFNLPAGSNAEVLTLAVNSDTNQKMAFPTLPRNVQHQWGEGQGGIQHPTDPSRRVEFNDGELWLKDGSYVLGNDREVSITVANGTVTINVSANVNITATGDVSVAAEGDATVSAEGDASLSAVGDVAIAAGGDMGLSADGNFSIRADAVDIISDAVRHNAANIGEDHRHPGVQSGSSFTGEPL